MIDGVVEEDVAFWVGLWLAVFDGMLVEEDDVVWVEL